MPPEYVKKVIRIVKAMGEEKRRLTSLLAFLIWYLIKPQKVNKLRAWHHFVLDQLAKPQGS
ncbi:MAG: hypothetical protein ACOY46_15080 [Bacillota bacterium]